MCFCIPQGTCVGSCIKLSCRSAIPGVNVLTFAVIVYAHGSENQVLRRSDKVMWCVLRAVNEFLQPSEHVRRSLCKYFRVGVQCVAWNDVAVLTFVVMLHAHVSEK